MYVVIVDQSLILDRLDPHLSLKREIPVQGLPEVLLLDDFQVKFYVYIE